MQLSAAESQVCADASNSFASSFGVRSARTSSIVRWRSSGGCGGRDFGIVDSSYQTDQVYTEPGRVHLAARVEAFEQRIQRANIALDKAELEYQKPRGSY